MKNQSSEIIEPATPGRDNTMAAGPAAGVDLGAVLADGALPVAVPITSQDDLLARLEARLADGMLDFSSALLEFARVSQSIHKELPLSAEFGKHITFFFSTFCLQFAYALFKDRDVPLLLDDGAQHLHKLGLSVDELFRELEVDGRRFLAIALVEQGAAHVLKDAQAGANTANP